MQFPFWTKKKINNLLSVFLRVILVFIDFIKTKGGSEELLHSITNNKAIMIMIMLPRLGYIIIIILTLSYYKEFLWSPLQLLMFIAHTYHSLKLSYIFISHTYFLFLSSYINEIEKKKFLTTTSLLIQNQES